MSQSDYERGFAAGFERGFLVGREPQQFVVESGPIGEPVRFHPGGVTWVDDSTLDTLSSVAVVGR